MLIDPFTVIAQVVNFLVLVWLLKRFLYKPILHAIEEREQRVAAQLEEAATKKAEAQKEREDFQHKNDLLDQQRAALLSKAAEEANSERQRLLEEARKEADALRSKRQEALRNEQRNLSREIIRRTQHEVFAIARKVLADLAATSLEERMADVFVRRLRELNGEEKDRLTPAPNATPHPAIVCSTFDLSPTQRAAIESAVKDSLAPATQVQFEITPELVSGIELTTNGHKVAWSIADYLTTLERNVGKTWEEKPQPTPVPKQGGTEHVA
jgi:F-type H+-transporting ATPase subunit b